jgi:serine/threonine-protein kinase
MSSESGETTVVRTIGRYRAFGELGRGAMGVVYRGFDPIIGRTVALKTLSIDTADPQAREFRDRLYREAAAAGALSHPNIVTIFDIIEDRGVTAVAMEFIEGRSLAAIIAERAPLAIDLAVEILDQMCSALDYAGSQGIVHRDIKPANILVTSAGRAKVTDFGVARLALSTMTQAGTVLGSPSYMSPEQVKGLSLDGRSDLFSAAVVFFEMITRERPFAGNDIATTMYRIAHEPPTPPSQFNPAIGPGVAEVLERAFAKNPADRFQTGADLVAELRAAASLGPTRGASPALAALAAAPPPVPPIVAPAAGMPGTSRPARDSMPAEVAPIPVTGAVAPAPAGSGGHALAPIPGSGLSPAGEPSSAVASGVELPAIPLPPEAVRPAGHRPVAAAPPAATPRRRGGLVVAGLAGVIVVVLGVAGALYLRDGWGPAVEEPSTGAGVPLLQQPEAPAVAVAPPAAPVTPPDALQPQASGAPAGGAPPRVPAVSPNRAGTRPLASQPAGPAPPANPASPPATPIPPATNEPSARVYQTTEVDVKPEVLTQVPPIYTDDAVKQNVKDVVVLQVLVDANGRPQTIRLLRGSQKAPLLNGAAAASVRQWTFKPARKDGQPVPCWFNVGVPFPPVK